MAQNYIGVDLSRDWIDVFDPRRGASRLDSSAASLTRWMHGLGPDDFLVFEATSGCDQTIRRLAQARSVAFRRINPLHGWHFARSLNLPKTDRVDAHMLARLGRERGLSADLPRSQARLDLAEMEGRREQIKRMIVQEKNRLQKATLPAIQADHRAVLAGLERRVAAIGRLIRDHLAAHPELARCARALATIPGIGPVAATVLIAYLPELGHLDRKAVASLGGLAPRARESGKWRSTRRIGDGRRRIRRALYMAALSAMRADSPFADTVRHLRDKGKPGKLIAIAIARRLLTIANAIIRDQTQYRANRP